MMKTVICHFYNEEFLLPWWLRHHGKMFDHGIMIDYASTDRSCELISRLCPTWEIVPSNNEYFDGVAIDQEVMSYERTLSGWRITLNVTEFLFGNMNRLHNRRGEMTQHLLTNYVFVDMEDPTKGPTHLLHDIPLHEQRYWGYHDNENQGERRISDNLFEIANGEGFFGKHLRMNRSIHNFPVEYTGGRHFPNTDYSFNDLVIFYYGWCDLGPQGLARRLQIKDKIGQDKETIHHLDNNKLLGVCREEMQPRCQDLRETIGLLSVFDMQNQLNSMAQRTAHIL
jgi:Glycosyl transferase family 2